MQLKICECVENPLFWQTVFTMLTEKLGIADYDKRVTLHAGQYEEDEAGSIVPDPTEDTIRRVKAGKQPRDFRILLEPRHPADMLQSFCHEMVHLKQACVGELTYRFVNGHPAQYWQNNLRITPDMPYMDRPQEKEAHARMNELALWVAQQLAARREGWNDFGRRQTA